MCALRTVGKRVLAQLNPFDFVVLLTLSNTVQNAIIGNDTSLRGGLVGAAALLGVNAMLVRIYYRGPSMQQMSTAERDICLIEGGRLNEPEIRRLRINAGELTAKAHERGFDSLDEVEMRRALSQRHDLLPRPRPRQRRGAPRRAAQSARCARRRARGAPPVGR